MDAHSRPHRPSRLRTRERLDIREIGRRLAAMSPAEIARLAEPEAAPAAKAAPAPGPAPAPRPASPPDAATLEPSGSAQAAAAQTAAPFPAERWDRVVLVPGLELLVRADGSPLLQRLAREIVQRYGLSAGAPEPCDDGP